MKRKVGVLLVNLGTPDSPKVSDVKKYLNEFLTDGRVIDYPWLKRQLLVRGIITPFRAKNSAATYKEIWSDEHDSPLLYYGFQLQEKLQEALANVDEETEYVVELAMRYQRLNIPDALMKLRKEAVSDIVVLPLFPQYASATTGSVHQLVMETIAKWPEIPNVRLINSYPTDDLMIAAYVENSRQYNLDDYDHVLFSFHGLPERQLRKADDYNYCLNKENCCEQMTEQNRFCYSAQSYATAFAIANELKLAKDQYTICFQSRLGKDPWMQPYTSEVLKDLAAKGMKKVLVFCPAFVADCLETIFEVADEYQEEFEEAGGEKVQLVESLNAHPLWVKSLKRMVLNN